MSTNGFYIFLEEHLKPNNYVKFGLDKLRNAGGGGGGGEVSDPMCT